MTIFSFGEVNV